jgi:GR25 family glycosyltransferase involved in LPS biosynthesis
VNLLSVADVRERFAHHVRLRLRLLDSRRKAEVFSSAGEPDSLQRIYVINLDRRPDRWKRLKCELGRFKDRHGHALTKILRRVSAVDARYMDSEPDPSILTPYFTLAEQLTVDPNPQLKIDRAAHARRIRMSRTEVAIALSHIEVWRRIADGDVPSALVLEDDVYLRLGFARRFGHLWSDLVHSNTGELGFDLLYLSFKDVGEAPAATDRRAVRRLHPGVWQASGYVQTRDGARKLLKRLPVHGPVDLWLNFQFDNLECFTAPRPLVDQRIDEPSSNSYSILPVLSQLGVITREKPLIPKARRLKVPIIAVGAPGSGLTALATALSMLGYTCCSDVTKLPDDELEALMAGRRGRFNAYANVGSLRAGALQRVIIAQGSALVIKTSTSASVRTPPERTLVLADVADKWAALSDFLELEYPPFTYPEVPELGQREVQQTERNTTLRPSSDMAADLSPWILPGTTAGWSGIQLAEDASMSEESLIAAWTRGECVDESEWFLRDDTFPSNLAIFNPANVVNGGGSSALLTLKAEQGMVRDFSSGAVASRQRFQYGRFLVELKPSKVPGLITGFFLHRNGPRQEIDIEFLGKDTTKMLVNVYYNPGPEGTRLEYGYRGTPTVVELGFDAAEDFHMYEIDWQPRRIRWLIDGAVAYERAQWQPCPIPDQPLELNVNLWHSRSTQLAGRLDTSLLPATAGVRRVEVLAIPESATSAA